MTTNTLRIATRQSALALWQAEFVKKILLKHHPDLKIELLKITSDGDKDQTRSLADIGGKDLFVKKLQQAILDDQADIAVHCIKDMSVHQHPTLMLGAILKRSNPYDVIVSRHATLKDGAIIGTASPRRQCLIHALYPTYQTKLLRGNVNTRLAKLDDGDYDAIVLAAAGLIRLGLENRITNYLPHEIFTPAIAQGALGIECKKDNSNILNLIKPLHDPITASCIDAERAVNQKLNGSCHTPMGAFATIDNQLLNINAFVGSLDGTSILRAHASGNANDALTLGIQAAEHLIDQGALNVLRDNHA